MDTVRRMTLLAAMSMMLTVLFFAISRGSALAATTVVHKPSGKTVKVPSTPATTTPAPELHLFKEATFLLPKGAMVSTHWVLPPTEKTDTGAMVSTDSTGSPLIVSNSFFSYGDTYLINPNKKYLVAIQATISGVTNLANGVILLASGSDIGLLAEPKTKSFDKKNIPIAVFQPLATLPLQKIDMLSSTGNSAYCAGFNFQTHRYTLYLLNTTKGAGLKDIELIYESNEPISAAAGNEDATFIAIGRNVIRVSKKDSSLTPLYTHPSDTVCTLAMTSAGLLAGTGRELVLVGHNGSLEIMRSSGHSIATRGDTVYILFQHSLGVLAIDNISDLARFNLAVRSVTAGEKQPPLVVDGLHFFESGSTPYAHKEFSDTFDRTQVRRIVAQIDLRNVQPSSSSNQQHIVTVSWYEPTGGQLLSTTYPVNLKKGEQTSHVFAVIGEEADHGGYRPRSKGTGGYYIYRVGKDALGLRYPGQYRVSVQVDGVPAEEKSFTLTGQAKPTEAIFYDDVAMLQNMLTQGLSPRNKTDEGTPILMVAVVFGSTRSVELLLKNGANPNDTDSEGKPPLAECTKGADWRAKAELLVRNGANVNATAGVNGNPLVHNYSFNPEYIAFLVKNGADIYSKDTIYKETVLARVTDGSNMCTEELVSLLLQRGADINASEGLTGYTPLGKAISRSDSQCVSLLLRKGASLSVAQNQQNSSTRSALYVALEKLFTQIRYGNPSYASEARRVVRQLIAAGATLTPGKKQLMFQSEQSCGSMGLGNSFDDCIRKDLENQRFLQQGEGRLMFKGEAPAFFDMHTLVRTLEQDDSALDEASSSNNPAIRELALRAHVSRVRELTTASIDSGGLWKADRHCDQAFKLAEAMYKASQLDVLPESVQNAQDKSILGASLLKRDNGGAYVGSLVPGGATERAGLKPGDIILALDTQKMTTVKEIAETVSRLPPGLPVRVTFLRDDPMVMPELQLTCGLLEKEKDDQGLAEMNLSHWLSANPNAGQAAAVRKLLGR